MLLNSPSLAKYSVSSQNTTRLFYGLLRRKIRWSIPRKMVHGLELSQLPMCKTRITGTRAFGTGQAQEIQLTSCISFMLSPLTMRSKLGLCWLQGRSTSLIWAALNYVCGLPQGSAGGLGKYCFNKGGGDVEKTIMIMTKEWLLSPV